MANEIKLTFAGDSAQLENTFDRVGGAARTMETEVRGAGEGFDRVGEAADNVDTRAMGFRDTLTGLQDGFAGIKQVTSGDIGFESLLLLGFGIGDLASGFYNLLIPAMKSAVTWLGNTKVGQLATAAATKVWTGAQWLMNTALFASPITWIVLGILALIAIIVLIATKTDWFSKAWNASWSWIKKAASNTWDFIKKIPGWIGSAFGKVGDLISRPFRTAFNWVADAWNNTVGRLSFSIPSWVPGVGGNGWSVPNIPKFHTGGVAPGTMGAEFLAVLRAGETVNASGSSSGGGGQGGVLEVIGTGSLGTLFAGAIRSGDIQLRVRNNRVVPA